MTGTAGLVGYLLLVGLVAPALLRRASWPQRAPGSAVLVWLGLMLSFVTALGLVAHHLVEPERHLHTGLLGFLHACGLVHVGGLGLSAASAAVLPPAAVLGWPLGWYGAVLLRARRARLEHLAGLELVARPAGAEAVATVAVGRVRAVVVEHGVPAVYCLPGRRRRIVLTRGALDVLSPEQLRAVLAHEHAHLTGRHHLVRAAVEAFARAFPGLPLGAAARVETAALLEMAADDRAVRRHSARALAGALGAVAAGLAPGVGLAAAGSPVVARVRRLLLPARGPHRLVRVAVAAAAAVAPLVPFLFACGPTGA
ncbi:M56 family metallopeptidase [Kitasatospora paracochleata]|uniref:Zn-dependent protease with chaperone function n=1 Tax=Kitasatospora paracochleata TaxID=58354 RepID=A0ABT1J4L9_9ACTN|nr:M56 family metallopeptidase [Kitasatospora paracochleata]MCP2312382.1 Zn-dependent protease with chaperone function [Kitasatospora paracochleata]